ncbi:helix-turn-helix transcriptional regulator [Candidatus Vondammii sp. HM_W22]|uniref:helix-turn-helix transcriptional regulator n=1 Tax=Candidatus Vondammii sp. HM_W22 TaxID=2687299 RepID=UPI001F12C0FB|nr:AlpA family phage regulatory protein [Candidatus Vondammii sp. HM_W22]
MVRYTSFSKHGCNETMWQWLHLVSDKKSTMSFISDKKSIKADFEAQVTTALMIQSNALIPFKLAIRLCGISRQEINRRIARGTFPKPHKLSRRENSVRIAFYLKDLHAWIKNPHMYLQRDYNG